MRTQYALEAERGIAKKDSKVPEDHYAEIKKDYDAERKPAPEPKKESKFSTKLASLIGKPDES